MSPRRTSPLSIATLLPFALLLLSACTATSTSSSAAAATASSSVAATAEPTATPLAGGGASASPSPTATPVAINPCKLLSAAQVTMVNGIAYGPGTVHNMSSGAVQCTWMNSASHASVVIQVAKLPSVTAADQAYAAAEAELNNFSVVTVANFADAAIIARAPTGTVTTGGIYVREADTFFDIVYLNGTPPSNAQLKLSATIVLGALG